MTIEKTLPKPPLNTIAPKPQAPAPKPVAQPAPKPASPPSRDTFTPAATLPPLQLNVNLARPGPVGQQGFQGVSSIPLHQLVRAGFGDTPPIAFSGSRQVAQVTEVAPVAAQTLQDPRTTPLELNQYISNPDSPETRAAIDQLLNSGDRQLVRYGEILQRAVNNPIYREWMTEQPPPTIILTTSAGNGNEPVLLLVPADFDPATPRPVVTYYHGVNLPVAGDPDPARTTDAIDTVWDNTSPDPLFILPETVQVPNDDGGSHGGWRLNGNLNVGQTTDDALGVIYGDAEPAISERVIAAHSRGGAALAVSYENEPGSLQADRLVLLDCTLDANIAPTAGESNPKDVDQVLATWVSGLEADERPEIVIYLHDYTAPYLETEMNGEAAVHPERDHLLLNETGLEALFPSTTEAAPTPGP